MNFSRKDVQRSKFQKNISCFLKIVPMRFKENIAVLHEPNTTLIEITQSLSEQLAREKVLPRARNNH